MDINKKYSSFLKGIPPHVKLVAVSKTKPTEMIEALYNGGKRDFGENKVQELLKKSNTLPKDILWHMIGLLQTNKVRQIIDVVHLIHSVDRRKLLTAINEEAKKRGKIVRILFQIKIAQEETKFGLEKDLFFSLCKEVKEGVFPNVSVCGVMGMASFTDNQSQVRKEFSALKAFFLEAKETFFSTEEHFQHISMGMSNDYKIAIEEGSTMIRVGSLIFGEREKP